MEEHVNFRSVYLRYGLFLGVALTILDLILLISENFTSPWTNLSYLFIAVLIFLGYTIYKKQGDGFLNYSRSLGLGTMITLIGGLISGLVGLMYRLVNTGVTEKIIEAQKQVLFEQGFSDTEIDQSMEFTAFLIEPIPSFFVSVAGYAFIGFIFSLVLGAIAKKNNPKPFE
ncbi:MAG: DUF4199 domain-containing protein [Bacteroidota bacterium]